MAAIRPWLIIIPNIFLQTTKFQFLFLKNLMMAGRRLNYSQQNQVYYVIDVYSKGREIFKIGKKEKICIKIIPYKVSSW
jgi:hypothetical protein